MVPLLVISRPAKRSEPPAPPPPALSSSFMLLPPLANMETPHFVVVIGATEDEVLLSDPARGIWNMSIDEVERLWNGVFFVVRQEASLARSNFNDSDSWKSKLWSPVDDAQMAGMMIPILHDLPLGTEFNTN